MNRQLYNDLSLVELGADYWVINCDRGNDEFDWLTLAPAGPGAPASPGRP